MKIPRVIQWACGIGLASVGLFIFFRSVDTHELARQLSHTHPLSLVACAALSVLTLFLRSIRWNLLLPADKTAHKKQLFPIIVIAFMINNILPARLGEVARAVLLWKKNKYSGYVSIGSIIVERVIDSLVFLACFFLPVFFIPRLSQATLVSASSVLKNTLSLTTFAVIAMAVFTFVVALFVTYSFFPQQVMRILTACAGPFRQKAQRIGAELSSTLQWTFSLWKVACVIALSFLIVWCYAAMTIVLIGEKWFGLGFGLFSQAFAALGAAIPLAPGYVGTLHALFLEGLSLCGLPRAQAGAVTILFHAVPYCTVTLLGLYYFFSIKVKFRDISEGAETIEKAEG